jgi:hypothetical protein
MNPVEEAWHIPWLRFLGALLGARFLGARFGRIFYAHFSTNRLIID